MEAALRAGAGYGGIQEAGRVRDEATQAMEVPSQVHFYWEAEV